MKRALILLSGVGASVYPILSCALGLGELQVDSRLNQPLRAHIEISDVSEEEWRQIHARLAQQGEGAVLLRTTLDAIVLRTTEDASHRHWVEMSSNDPITEPLFDLSVEVAGQTVQVIRNYSVFLDPPGRDEAGSRAVVVAGNGGTQGAASPGVVADVADRAVASAAEAAASAPAQGAGSRGAARGVNARSAARSAARRSIAGGDAAGTSGAAGAADSVGAVSAARTVGSTGTAGGATAAGRASARGANSSVGAGAAVGAGANQQVGLQAGAIYTVVQSDTLERIVRRLGARTAAAKNQQMQWVFEHNPGAFYGSMDRLRAGAQLTLPGQGAAATAALGSAAPAASTANTADAVNVPSASNAPAVPKGPEVQRTPVAVAGQKVTAPDDPVLPAQLAGQVSTLQQTLDKLQETIAAQDAQIADLKRKIAARAEQQRAERTTNALAARFAPEAASSSDDSAQSPVAAASRSEPGAANSVPRWWAKRATYYWAGALGAAAILVAVLVIVIRRRREAEATQYAPRYPLVEDSPFRYQATLESPPPSKQAPPRQPEPEVRQPKPSSGLQVEEPVESGLESWSTQTALLLSDLPAPDDTQPFMMAPHDDVESEFADERRSLASSAAEPTAKLQAMETHTVELQTTGELMTPEELAEAELLGMVDQDAPAHGRHEESSRTAGASSRVGQDERHRAASGQGEDRRAANEPGPFGQAEGRAGQGGRPESSWALGEPSPFGRGESRAGSSGAGRGGQGESHRGAGADRTASSDDDARTVEIGSEELLAAEALSPTNPEAGMDLAQLRAAQMSTTEIQAAELRRERTAASKEVAEILEASLNYEPDRVDIKLKLLEIYHHEALGNRENFRSLLNKLAKDSRLLSPAQRQHVETLQRTLNDGKQDVDSSFVAEVAI